jgi:hypothetical protein
VFIFSEAATLDTATFALVMTISEIETNVNLARKKVSIRKLIVS